MARLESREDRDLGGWFDECLLAVFPPQTLVLWMGALCFLKERLIFYTAYHACWGLRNHHRLFSRH